jgi:hypothetical protein
VTASLAVRAARHRLVAEIGESGVERLAASHVRLRESSPFASEVARRFLERAEVTCDEAGARGPDEDPALDYLEGSLVALDHVARITGVRQAPMPREGLAEVLRVHGGGGG